MKVAKSMFVGALVLGGLVAVAAPASADFRRADIRQDRREFGHDYAELNRDRREYFHDLHNGASRAELAHDRREIWQDRREIRGDRRDLHNDRWDHRGWWHW
jgi:hypothetical protein